MKELHHRIAFGRHFSPSISGRPINASFSLKASDPSRPISHPVEITDPEGFGFSDVRHTPSTFFAPGDGAGTATWTWEDSRFPGCLRTFSYVLHPRAGLRPAIEVKLEEGDAEFISLNQPDGRCIFQNEPGGEVLQFGRGRHAQKMTMEDVCDVNFSPKELESPDWLAFVYGESSVRLKPRFDQPGLHRVPYWARFRGKVFAYGAINIATRGQASRVLSITRHR